MAWPTPQDYNEAVQNPRHAFSDPDLQSGTPETTVLGLPRPITGNFASVYRFHCGSRSWAVRCFWRERDDMQQRYAAISQHLSAAALPYTVQFEYQAEGVRIRGKWYPILKMEWQEGELLHEYLASHLQDSTALTALAEQWRHMVADLEAARTAHGDLQHGNVMMVHGSLKLVDYDGMYVPALKGMGSHELGLQHYQHPERSAESFDERLDRFAAWVIYVSILALARDPSLWEGTGAGDERLLFAQHDFRESGASPTFSLLVQSADPEVKAAAVTLRQASASHIGEVPALTSWPSSDPAIPASVATDSPNAAARFLEICRNLAPPVAGDTVCEPAATHPEWLVGYLEAAKPALPVASRGEIGTVRACTTATLPLAATLAVALDASGLSITLISITVIALLFVSSLSLLVAFYRRQPAVRGELATRRRQRELRRRIESAARQRSGLERELNDTLDNDRRTLEGQREQHSTLESNLADTTASQAQWLTDQLGAIDDRIAHDEQVKRDALAALLSEQRARHAAECRRKALLRTAHLPDIDWREKCRLWAMGVWSAADVSAERLRAARGLRDSTVLTLVGWRIEVERGVRRSLPREAVGPTVEAMCRRHVHQRAELMQRRYDLELRSAETLHALGVQYADRKIEVDQDAAAALNANEEARKHLRESLADNLQHEIADRREIAALASASQGQVIYTFADFVRVTYFPWTSQYRRAGREPQ